MWELPDISWKDGRWRRVYPGSLSFHWLGSEVWKNEWIGTFCNTELDDWTLNGRQSERNRFRHQIRITNGVSGLLEWYQVPKNINCLPCTLDVSRLTVTWVTRVSLHSVIFTLRSLAASSSSSLVVLFVSLQPLYARGELGGDFSRVRNMKIFTRVLESVLRAGRAWLLYVQCICWTVDYWLDQQLKYWF